MFQRTSTELSSDDPWPDDAALGPPIDYPSGATIFHHGARIHSVHLVASGAVALTIDDSDRQVLEAVCSRNWLLGAGDAILGERYQYTAIVLSDVCLRGMTLNEFKCLYGRDLRVAQWIGRMLAREAHANARRLTSIGTKDSRARVEWILGELLRAHPVPLNDGAIRIGVALKTHELSRAIAVSREQVSRIMKVLVDEGVVLRRQGWLVVPAESPLLASKPGEY